MYSVVPDNACAAVKFARWAPPEMKYGQMLKLFEMLIEITHTVIINDGQYNRREKNWEANTVDERLFKI